MGRGETQSDLDTFNTLLANIWKRAAIGDLDQIERVQCYLKNSLHFAHLSAKAMQEFEPWTTDPDRFMDHQIHQRLLPADLTEILQLLYLSYCAALGPIAVERIFAQAVSETAGFTAGWFFLGDESCNPTAVLEKPQSWDDSATKQDGILNFARNLDRV